MKRMTVTVVDHASSSVRIADERASEGLEIRYAETSRLAFGNSSYQVVTAFVGLCLLNELAANMKEMFRVSSQAVIITELNTAGRKINQHLDGGFHQKSPDLLSRHCADRRRFDKADNVTYVCEKPDSIKP